MPHANTPISLHDPAAKQIQTAHSKNVRRCGSQSFHRSSFPLPDAPASKYPQKRAEIAFVDNLAIPLLTDADPARISAAARPPPLTHRMPMPENFVATISSTALRVGKYVRHQEGAFDLLIIHIAEGFFAIENKCSHQDMPLNRGRLGASSISCPVHGGVFDVRTGCALKFPAGRPVRTFPVRISGEMIEVNVGAGPAA